jgi:outer membrane protein assembly factor BamB
MVRPRFIGLVFIAAACSGPDEPPKVLLPDTASPSDVTTFQNDPQRTGVTRSETVLTPQRVQQGPFGKKATFAVDGFVYAQPLLLSHLTVNGTQREVLFVATQHDSVYAFDASGQPSEPLWHAALLAPGEIPVPSLDTNTTDIIPEVGITGTPVIDPSASLLYVVSKAKRADGSYVQRLHALRLADGTEAPRSPIDITAQVPGTGKDAIDGQIRFEALKHNQRSALALIDGRVWIVWASHGDTLPYHGWVLAYDTANLAAPPITWNSTPDGGEGGIWMAASGPSTDGRGNVYMSSGNGSFEEDVADESRRRNFANAALRLRIEGDHIVVADWFMPRDRAILSAEDLDFGSIGAILLPDQAGSAPHRLVTAHKRGIVYVINRDDFGHFEPLADRVIQRLSVNSGLFIANPAFFEGTLYVCPSKVALSAYKIDPSTGLFRSEPVAVAPPCDGCFRRGSAPSISANGDHDAIVWLIDNSQFADPGPAILHAYDASDLHQLYDSSASADGRDAAAFAVKFTRPVIANGRVYVGGQYAVTAYGLLDP